MRWVGNNDERIVSSIRNKLGLLAKGTVLFEHVKTYYVQAMVGDAAEAEKAFKAFDYEDMFNGTEEHMHDSMDRFTNILSHPCRRAGKETQKSGWSFYQRNFQTSWPPNTTATCAS